MSALVERIIAARDRLSALDRRDLGYGADVKFARDAMADAANALTERDETIHALRRQVERRDEALAGLIEHARPTNWDDDDDPEQVLAWQVAMHIAELKS